MKFLQIRSSISLGHVWKIIPAIFIPCFAVYFAMEYCVTAIIASLIFRRINPPQIVNRMSWTLHCAHSTAQADRLFYHCTVICNLDCLGRTGLLTDSTADTADVTLLLCFCTFFLIGTFYHNVVCTLMDMDHFLWADFRTGATANAFLLIHTSATPYSLMEMAPNLHLSIQALHPIHPSAQPASPSADLHPPLHATTAARYGNFFFTALFSTSFHMVFRSEEDYTVFHHSI